MRQLRFVPATLALALLTAACDLEPRVTTDAARTTWAASQPRAKDRIAALRDRHRVLAGRIGELRVTEGTEDAPLTRSIAALQGQVSTIEAQLGTAEAAFAQVSAEVESALGKQNKVEARRVVELSLASIEPSIAAADDALDALEPQVAGTESAMQRGAAAIEAEKQRLRRIAYEGGRVDLTDLEFKADGSELMATGPAGSAARDRLVAFATACEGLRFTIAGHSSRAGEPARQQARSLARAEAVKRFLVATGVAADKIEKTDGLGGTRPVVEEPAPGSAAAGQLAPEELASRQRRNERIEIVVTRPCTADAAAAAPATRPDSGQPAPIAVERPAPGTDRPVRTGGERRQPGTTAPVPAPTRAPR